MEIMKERKREIVRDSERMGYIKWEKEKEMVRKEGNIVRERVGDRERERGRDSEKE